MIGRAGIATAALALALLQGCASTSVPPPPPPSAAAPSYDLLIRGGTIYDGSGAAPYVGDIGIRGDRIVYAGPAIPANAARIVDAQGLAVTPGFINMLSWATESLLVDGLGQSDLRQGVTLEVMGEGWSMGPLNDQMKKLAIEQQGDFKYPIEWTTLGQYLTLIERRGTTMNVASFVGATTVRQHELGERDVDPTPEQLKRMRALVRQAMQEGALGVGTSLIYPPASFAETDELVALTSEAARCGGTYISHMRSEGDRLLESIDEVIEISRRSGAPAEIYHLKQVGKANWPKIDQVIAKIEAARASGLKISADMYLYTAGGTGLAASMPPWVQDGGVEAMLKRLKDPTVVARVKREMLQPGSNWENLYLHAGPAGVQLASLIEPSLKPLIGKTVAEVAKMRGVRPEQAVIDLVLADKGRAGAIYFLMSEENVRRQAALAMGQLGVGCRSRRARGCVSQIEHSSARLWQFRAVPRQICPRREGRPAGRRDPPADVLAGKQPWPARPRFAERGDGGRRRAVRSGHNRRPRDVRPADAICHRRPPRLRQWRSGAQGWPTDRRQIRPFCQRGGLDGLAQWRGVRAEC